MTIDVLQLSDIHLMGPSRGSVAPMFERDADETLDAVLADVRRRGRRPDVVVATGDLVHDGAPGAYDRVAAALGSFGAPAYCLAGNHDRAASFDANLSRSGIHVGRFANFGSWAFAFVDSNRGGRVANDAGALWTGPIATCRPCTAKSTARSSTGSPTYSRRARPSMSSCGCIIRR